MAYAARFHTIPSIKPYTHAHCEDTFEHPLLLFIQKTRTIIKCRIHVKRIIEPDTSSNLHFMKRLIAAQRSMNLFLIKVIPHLKSDQS